MSAGVTCDALTKREDVMDESQRTLLHQPVPVLIEKWEKKLGVKVSGYFLQRMKTRWGGCNHRAGNIRLNTELAKKPKSDHPPAPGSDASAGHVERRRVPKRERLFKHRVASPVTVGHRQTL